MYYLLRRNGTYMVADDVCDDTDDDVQEIPPDLESVPGLDFFRFIAEVANLPSEQIDLGGYIRLN